MQKAIKILKKINRIWHREIFDPFLLLFFSSAEDALCSVYNSKSVCADDIISNYCKSMLVFGIDKKEKIFWHRKDNLYWQIFKLRGIITPETAHLSRRLKSYMKKDTFEIRYNTDFDRVIRCCQERKVTWINEELIALYKILEKRGYVQTVETYLDGKLVGGFWGFVIGKNFSIISMFHEVDRAGAIALGDLVERLQNGEFGMIDCGANNDTFKRFGAVTVSREEFIRNVMQNMKG